MFILSCTNIYLFVKNISFEYLYSSEYHIRMFLFVFCLRNRSSIKYVRNWGNGGGSFKMFLGATGGEGYHVYVGT